MQNLVGMRKTHGVHDLDKQRHGPIDGNHDVALQNLFQAFSIDVFDDDEGLLKGAESEVESSNDVWMVELSQSFRFQLQTVHVADVSRQLRGQELYSHDSVSERMARLVDHAHAAGGYDIDNFVLIHRSP